MEQLGEASEGARELRGSCLRLLAQVLERFPDAGDYNFMWPRFFGAVAPLLPRISTEVPPQLHCSCRVHSVID